MENYKKKINSVLKTIDKINIKYRSLISFFSVYLHAKESDIYPHTVEAVGKIQSNQKKLEESIEDLMTKNYKYLKGEDIKKIMQKYNLLRENRDKFLSISMPKGQSTDDMILNLYSSFFSLDFLMNDFFRLISVKGGYNDIPRKYL
jgi:hypothetical protein